MVFDSCPKTHFEFRLSRGYKVCKCFKMGSKIVIVMFESTVMLNSLIMFAISRQQRLIDIEDQTLDCWRILTHLSWLWVVIESSYVAEIFLLEFIIGCISSLEFIGIELFLLLFLFSRSLLVLVLVFVLFILWGLSSVVCLIFTCYCFLLLLLLFLIILHCF